MYHILHLTHLTVEQAGFTGTGVKLGMVSGLVGACTRPLEVTYALPVALTGYWMSTGYRLGQGVSHLFCLVC